MTGIVGNGAILKAIDDEHREIVRAAQAIYDERMKPARSTLETARRVWEKAQAAFRAEELRHAAEHKENVAEAQRRRTELRQAVTGTRPVRIADIAKVTVVAKESGARVSLPRMKFIGRATEDFAP